MLLPLPCKRFLYLELENHREFLVFLLLGLSENPEIQFVLFVFPIIGSALTILIIITECHLYMHVLFFLP
jgi:hypothetical protein